MAEEYEAFVEKFKPKLTTDDCYTPEPVYEVICSWVENEYSVDRKDFVRPFYPGGDYVNYKYGAADIVVDNPPFSILSQIIRFYHANKIRFFLFAPALTLFSAYTPGVCYISTGASIKYENGAVVSTSFITNLDRCAVRSAPKLYQQIKDAQKNPDPLPKYDYPEQVLTQSLVASFSKLGIDFAIADDDLCKIGVLDHQREFGKTIFGSGFLLSEKAAAEKAAAEKAAAEKAAAEKAAAEKANVIVWELSEREKRIIETLGKGEKYEQLSLVDL